jgi:hypothetical protein
VSSPISISEHPATVDDREAVRAGDVFILGQMGHRGNDARRAPRCIM